MKIKSLQDIKKVSEIIIGNLISNKGVATFNLVVNHGNGSFSNCAWTPACAVGEKQQFLAVEDYEKIMLLLFEHHKVHNLAYDEKYNMVTAVYNAGEMMEQMKELEEQEHCGEWMA